MDEKVSCPFRFIRLQQVFDHGMRRKPHPVLLTPKSAFGDLFMLKIGCFLIIYSLFDYFLTIFIA